MSKWTDFRDKIENSFSEFFSHAEAEVTEYVQPAIVYITANGGHAALEIAETVLATFATGAPWSEILAAFIAKAEEEGITLARGSAQAILSVAQSNAIAKAA